jgi:Ser/Thr protein kinase RdoA (MazF antagonist)
MAGLRWRRSRYATTHTLLEAEGELADGSTLPLMLKRIDVGGSLADRSDGKPTHVYDGMREVLVYRALLADREPDVPFLYGVVRARGATPGSWLLLERIRGRELYQFEAIERWEEVAAWLAGFHARGQAITRFQVACRAARLLEYTPRLLRGWYSRACQFASARAEKGTRRALERLAGPYLRAVDFVLQLPRTLIHGDFYPSNVLLEEKGGSAVVRPVDWELAGFGPGLFDLAALTAGDWSEPARDRIAAAYREALPTEYRTDRATFESSLQACRLIVAVQWLGWGADWTPPHEHRTDWLTTALNAAVLLDMGPR